MAGRRIVVVSEDLFRKINEHRGELEPAEFIELCIDTLLDLRKKREDRRGDYIRREEFDNFRKEMREFLEAFSRLLLDSIPQEKTPRQGLSEGETPPKDPFFQSES